MKICFVVLLDTGYIVIGYLQFMSL